MTETAPLLQVENLRTWLHQGAAVARAVDGMSFEIGRGETFSLLGESGSGKSMTALSIMRLLPETGEIVSGAVRLEGEDLLAVPESAMREIRGKRLSMIFQEPMLSLNPVLTVGQQIGEVLAQHGGMAGGAMRARVLQILDAVGIPDGDRRHGEYPFQLSGGMKQRVMIAMALACEPSLLIADEPTTALDVTIQAQVLDLMRELQQRNGTSILLITHDLGVVAEMAHKVAVMYAGQIVESAPANEFFANPSHPYSKKLFASLPAQAKRDQALAVIRGTVPQLSQEFKACRFADRCDYCWDLCRNTPPAWIDLSPGHGVRCHLFDPHAAGAETAKEERAATAASANARPGAGNGALLHVDDLKVYFPIRKGVLQRTVGFVKAVDGVSLDIPQGRTLALVGESGCGKTTVGKGILQLVKPTAGSVRLGDVEVSTLERDSLRQKRREFQIIFQDPYASLNPRLRVAEIIEEGMTALGIGADGAERSRRIDELLLQVGLTPDMRGRYPHEFSGGQRQRIAIARALAVNPKLIICDEPTSALDVSVQAQILNLLKELQDGMGLSYLFITHNISVVEYLAHEVAVMYLGRIVEHGRVDEVLRAPRHPYTRALLSAVPVIEPESRRSIIRLEGDLPSPANPPAGCHFHPRCPDVMPRCRGDYPGTTRFTATHSARCYLYTPEKPD